MMRVQPLLTACVLVGATLTIGCGDGAGTGPTSGSASTGEGGSADVGGAGGMGQGGTGGDDPGGAGGRGGEPAACPTDETPEPGLVITEYGAVQGTLAGDTYAFKGIPFAAPPIGPRRFRPPEPPDCIDGKLYASAFGNWCPQPDNLGGTIGNEDCLSLNVWAPADPPSSPRAVMVWIHGGGNINGASGRGGDDDPLFNGQPYVEQADVVFVSINYRLGALGFMAHPALTAEDPNGAAGNNALLDQIAALEWVQRNIAQFGGDPDRVMIFGQSAGAVDICALKTSPLAAGLFHRTLMSSGACVSQTLAERESTGIALAADLGCSSGDVAECLRTLPAADIALGQPSNFAEINPLGMEVMPFGPTVDGYVLPKDPLQALSDGDHHDVPFVLGSNADEAALTVQPIVTLNQYEQIVYDHYGQADGDLVLQMYDPQDFPTPRRALIDLSTDATWTCPVRRAARAAAANQVSPVYRYFFTHALEGAAVQGLGAFHAVDVYFTFQHTQATTYTLSAAELTLSQDILGYWSRFAVTGDPNGASAVVWPTYVATGDDHLILDTTIATDPDVRPARCDLLDGLL